MPVWNEKSYNLVNAAWKLITHVSDAADAATLNAQTVPTDIQWSQIRDVLMNNFDWGTLVLCCNTAVNGAMPGPGITAQTTNSQAAALAIRECCLDGGMFTASNPTSWAKLTAAAALLTPSSGTGAISAASAAAVLALRQGPSWVPALSAQDIAFVRINNP